MMMLIQVPNEYKVATHIAAADKNLQSYLPNTLLLFKKWNAWNPLTTVVATCYLLVQSALKTDFVLANRCDRGKRVGIVTTCCAHDSAVLTGYGKSLLGTGWIISHFGSTSPLHS